MNFGVKWMYRPISPHPPYCRVYGASPCLRYDSAMITSAYERKLNVFHMKIIAHKKKHCQEQNCRCTRSENFVQKCQHFQKCLPCSSFHSSLLWFTSPLTFHLSIFMDLRTLSNTIGHPTSFSFPRVFPSLLRCQNSTDSLSVLC